MNLTQIQHEIEQLPEDQRMRLVAWLAQHDNAVWDEEIESDFSLGGAGMELLERVKSQVRNGNSFPLSEGPHRS